MNTAPDANRRLLYLLCVVIISVFVYLQILHFLNVPEPFQEPDSIEFLNATSAPQAWGSIKPPFVPFVYNLLGGNIHLIVNVQLAFSLFSWTFLAYAASRSLKCGVLIPVLFILILGFGLSDMVSIWNKSILSESFSLSLLACFTGAWFLVLDNISLKKVLMLIIFATAFALTRTANGFTLMMLVPVLIIAVLIKREKIERRYYLIVVISFFVLFLISNSISNTKNRWAPYFLNVLSMRILTDEGMMKYFEDHGMPITDSLMARSGRWSHEDDFAYYRDPDLEQFREWLYSKGKSTYARYLLTHPAYLFSEPMQDFKRMMFSTKSRLMYYAPKGFTSPLQGKLFDYLSAWSLFIIYVFIAGVLFGSDLVYAFSKEHKIIWIPLIIILLVYPLAVLTWHADAMEIERHALPVAVQARLGFILLLLFAADKVIYDKLPAFKQVLRR